MDDSRKCICTFAQKMVGDGCDVCNSVSFERLQELYPTLKDAKINYAVKFVGECGNE